MEQTKNILGYGSGQALALAGALGFATACHEHVELHAPPSNASLSEREQSYESLHPLSTHEIHVTYYQGFTPVGAERLTDYLQIANGRRVYYPEDILPVVDSGSPAAAAAQASESARTTANTLTGVAAGGYVLGLGLIIVPFVNRSPGESLNTTPLYAGAGIALASCVAYFVGRSFRGTENDEAATAFETYDAGLRKKLNLCVEGKELTDCK